MKKIFLSILLTAFTFNAIAQIPLRERSDTPPQSSILDRIYFGGSCGLQFGTQTFIEVAPIVGYKITDRLSAGLGLKYQYYKFHLDNVNYSTNIYGGGPFTQFLVYEGLFLHAEYEVLNLEVPDYYYLKFRRKNITSVFLGGGYRQMIGQRSSLDLLLLYNINESNESPYQNPIFRVGFGFGI